MFNDYEDFYTLFEQYPKEFTEASSYDEFIKATGKDYLRNYLWACRVFDTAKAGKRTYRPLSFPKVESFSELFLDAQLLPTDQKVKPKNYVFLSGGTCMHIGGKRTWSETCPNTRAHFGGKFNGTYVLPKPYVHGHKMTLADHPASYEMVKREDGILILAHDGLCIGSDWLALLPLTEDIETLFNKETRALLATEREAKVLAWGV
jgi:hypothetical protein